MAWDAALPATMRGAGPALFFLLGLAIVALSRGRLERIAVGAFILSTGGFLLAANLYLSGVGEVFLVIQVPFALLTSITGIACLVWPPVRTRIPPLWLAAIGLFVLTYAVRVALVIAELAARNVRYSLLGPDFTWAIILDVQVGGVGQALLFALPFAWAIQARRAASNEIRLLAGLSAGLLVFIGFAAGTDFLSGHNIVLLWAPELAVAGTLGGAAAWLWVGMKRASPVARNVALAALAALALGMLRHAVTGVDSVLDPYGTVGVARLAGWVILALTVVHAGWIDVRFLSRHRTGMAMAALATLFIVAQIAQNFFSAQYGLLTGGIVAGTFLFLASPVQRAIERVGGRTSGPMPQVADAQEKRFRDALRLALRDKKITRDEEVQLHQLAEGLGIGAGRAHELLVEVEGASKQPRKGKSV